MDQWYVDELIVSGLQERLRQADRQRLLRLAGGGRSRERSTRRWIGEFMIRLGTRLERGGEVMPAHGWTAPVSSSAD